MEEDEVSRAVSGSLSSISLLSSLTTELSIIRDDLKTLESKALFDGLQPIELTSDRNGANQIPTQDSAEEGMEPVNNAVKELLHRFKCLPHFHNVIEEVILQAAMKELDNSRGSINVTLSIINKAIKEVEKESAKNRLLKIASKQVENEVETEDDFDISIISKNDVDSISTLLEPCGANPKIFLKFKILELSYIFQCVEHIEVGNVQKFIDKVEQSFTTKQSEEVAKTSPEKEEAIIIDRIRKEYDSLLNFGKTEDTKYDIGSIIYSTVFVIQELPEKNYSIEYYNKILKVLTSETDEMQMQKSLSELLNEVAEESFKEFCTVYKLVNLVDENMEKENFLIAHKEAIINCWNDPTIPEFRYSFLHQIDNLMETEQLQITGVNSLISGLRTVKDKDPSLQLALIQKSDLLWGKTIEDLLVQRRENIIKYEEEMDSLREDIFQSWGRLCGILSKSETQRQSQTIGCYLQKCQFLGEIDFIDGSFTASKGRDILMQIKTEISALGVEQSCLLIEGIISRTLNNLWFSKAIENEVDFFSDFVSSFSPFFKNVCSSQFKRTISTKDTIKLEDIFNTFGRISEVNFNKVFVKNFTVLIPTEDENDFTFFRLAENISFLKTNTNEYKEFVTEFRSELLSIHKFLSFKKLEKTLQRLVTSETFDRKAIISFTSLLTVFLCAEEICDEECLKNSKCLSVLSKLFKWYSKIIENLMFSEKPDQEVMSLFRLVLDQFMTEVLTLERKEKEDNKFQEMLELIRSLRVLVTEKTYILYPEQFQTNSSTEQGFLEDIKARITQIQDHELPQLILLRSVTSCQEILGNGLQEIIENEIPITLENLGESCLKKTEEYFIEKKKMLLNIQEGDSERLFLEKLALTIDATPTSSNSLYLVESLKNLCQIVIKDLEIHENFNNSNNLFEISIYNSFNSWLLDRQGKKQVSVQDFITHIKQLENIMKGSTETLILQQDLERAEVSFISTICSFIPETFQYLAFSSDVNDVSFILQFLLLLPDSYFLEENKHFIQLIEQLQSMLTNCSPSFENLVKEVLFRFFTLFISPSEENNFTKELGRRLYLNATVSEFLDVSLIFATTKEDLNQVSAKLLSSNSEESPLLAIMPFLHKDELSHVISLLRGEECRLGEFSDIPLREELVHLLRDEGKVNKIFKDICNVFYSKEDNFLSPPHLWREDLIALRVMKVNSKVTNMFSLSEKQKEEFSNSLEALRYLCEENGNILMALDVLKMAFQSNRFMTFEECKTFVHYLLYFEDLEAVVSWLVSKKGSILVEMTFCQVLDVLRDTNVWNDEMGSIRSTLCRLKLILVHHKFPEVAKFCQIFFHNLREKQDLKSLTVVLHQVIQCRVYKSPELLKELQEIPISSWITPLEKVVIKTDLEKIAKGNLSVLNEKTLRQSVTLLFSIKSTKGSEFYDKLLAKLQNLTPGFNSYEFLDILQKIEARSVLLENIDELSGNIRSWEAKLFPQSFGESSELSVQELITAMCKAENVGAGGINETVKESLQLQRESVFLIEHIIASARNLDRKSVILPKSPLTISQWKCAEIEKWGKALKLHPRREEILSWDTSTNKEIIVELLSVLIKATQIYDHLENGPRNTQFISLLLFLNTKNDNGRLANIYTGEGKTLLTVLLSVSLALLGNRVDVVTSSKVLAVRDSKQRVVDSKNPQDICREGYQGFFSMFGLIVGNNCDELCENPVTGERERRERYKTCDVIYGETGYFQRDILLTNFLGKDIREGGNGVGDILILDEGDSMMIDNAAKTLYISHEIIDLRYLRDLFLQICAAVNTKEERFYSPENVEKVVKYIQQLMDPNDSFSQESGLCLKVPSTLKPFVDLNLKTWVESAYDAKYMKEKDAYIIGDSESQKENEVIIMDKDTGVEQTTSKWSNGLHQFIQLKHFAKLSDVSLKAVYISNISFFQSYKKLFGMTGTVGGENERNVMAELFGIDFFEMPRFINNRFEYDFDSESVSQDKEDWAKAIIENVEENMEQELHYSDADKKSFLEKGNKTENELRRTEFLFNKSQKELLILAERKQKSEEIIKLLETVVNLKEKIDEAEDNDDKLDSVLAEVTLPELSQEFAKVANLQNQEDKKNLFTSLHECLKIDSLMENLSKNLHEKYEQIIEFLNKEKEELSIVDELISTESSNSSHLSYEIRQLKDDKIFYDSFQNKKVPVCRDSRRAVLIICDNISDIDFLVERMQPHFKDPEKHRIHRYDRAYKKFDSSILTPGDIIIATNIAGRGTDLKMSPQVLANGGLHVILSYMPRNLRIEHQAFGRTARAGQRGTGTYIIYDPMESEDSISEMKIQRNDEENQRLITIQNEQIPKLKLEADLFQKFNSLQKTVKKNLSKDWKEKGLDLQMDSLKNLWALWLDKVKDELSKNEREKVFHAFSEFEKGVEAKLSKQFGLVQEPGLLIKLGRVFLDEKSGKEIAKAILCFDQVINLHGDFSAIAQYYKSVAIIKKGGGGIDAKIRVNKCLKKCLTELSTLRNQVIGRNQILKTVNQISLHAGSGQQSNYFSQQNEGEAQLLSLHINAIRSAIGHEIEEEAFQIPQKISEKNGKQVFEKLKEKGVIKGHRFSKKCRLGHKLFITERAKQETIFHLNEPQGLHFKDAKTLIQDVRNGFLISTNNSDDSKIMQHLVKCNIFSEKELFMDNEIIMFPSVFSYCKQQVLNFISSSMSSNRLVFSSSFEPFIYTKDQFKEDCTSFIEEEQVISISSDVRDILLGTAVISHPVFLGKGAEIREILCQEYLKIDSMKLDECVTKNGVKFGKEFLSNISNEIKTFCKFDTSNSSRLVSQKDLLNHLDTTKLLTEKNVHDVLSIFGLGEICKYLPKHQITEVIQAKLNGELTKDQTDIILNHLEFHETIKTDFTQFENLLKEVKNNSIFQDAKKVSKQNELRNFLAGKRCVNILEEPIFLVDGEEYDKKFIISCLKQIVLYPQDKDPKNIEIESNFLALLSQLGFDKENPLKAVTSMTNLRFKDCSNKMEKLERYLSSFSLNHLKNCEIVKEKIQNLDFSIYEPLLSKSENVIKCLIKNLGKDSTLSNKNFKISKESFSILRGLLTDANLIKTNLFNELSDTESEPENFLNNNPELENVLYSMYANGGSFSENDLVLKEKRPGSTELLNRLIDQGVIKLPKIYFSMLSNPEKRLERIKAQVEQVIKGVLHLERKSDLKHKANLHVTGGIGTESENKDLDEAIDSVFSTIKNSAGIIRTAKEVKFEMRDISSFFEIDTNPPPREILDYSGISFELVIDCKEDKGFNWDVLCCVLLGVAQIAIGVAIEICSGGSAHYLAQIFISEGIGDIIFALVSHYQDNFSWEAYRQHKVQSVMISLVTAGVGKFLSKGAKVGKIAVGLATKTAVAKAIIKTTAMETISAVVASAVNVGADEICKTITHEIANTHFTTKFHSFVKEDLALKTKMNYIENSLLGLYKKYGVTIAQSYIAQSIQDCFYSIVSGSLGAQVFNQVAHFMRGVTNGISSAAGRLGKGNSKAQVLGFVAQSVNKLFTVSTIANNLVDLCQVSYKFCDHFSDELKKLETKIEEDGRQGKIDLSAEKIADEKKNVSFTEKVSEDLSSFKDGMSAAFIAKVKSGFLQPAVSFMLHKAAKPIQEIISAPFRNAMQDLNDHIDSRAKRFMQDILEEGHGRVPQLNSRQKKGLELRGEIISVRDVSSPHLLAAEPENFPGHTIQTLQERHGDSVSVFVKDGKLYAVLPTFTQLCNNIGNNLKAVGPLQAQVAATMEKRPIEFLSEDLKLNGMGKIDPISGTKMKENDSFKIKYCKEDGENVGHCLPVVMIEGKEVVVTDISQNSKESKDACFAQCMIFLKAFSENNDYDKALKLAMEPKEISKYYENLAKAARTDKSFQSNYYEGVTTSPKGIFGGLDTSVYPIEEVLRSGKYCPSVTRKVNGRFQTVKLSGATVRLTEEMEGMLKEIKREKNKETRDLRREIFARELFHLAEKQNDPDLKEGYRNLAFRYNDGKAPINGYTFEFSQNEINQNFRQVNYSGSDFPHGGKSVKTVGEIKPFPYQDFCVKVFLHPEKKGVLVIDNNRGGAAHALANHPIVRIRLTKAPSNFGAFKNRTGDGLEIRIPGEKRPIKMQDKYNAYFSYRSSEITKGNFLHNLGIRTEALGKRRSSENNKWGGKTTRR